MREILIFAGTTEGRKLSEVLCDSGIHHRICVATEYGEILLKHHPCRKIHRGRMEPEEMRDFIVKGSFAAVVDGTHPYAEIVTKNIQAAVESQSAGRNKPLIPFLTASVSESSFAKIP